MARLRVLEYETCKVCGKVATVEVVRQFKGYDVGTAGYFCDDHSLQALESQERAETLAPSVRASD